MHAPVTAAVNSRYRRRPALTGRDVAEELMTLRAKVLRDWAGTFKSQTCPPPGKPSECFSAAATDQSHQPIGPSVAAVALRPPRPRRAGVRPDQRVRASVAPLYAAPPVAARRVPPSTRIEFLVTLAFLPANSVIEALPLPGKNAHRHKNFGASRRWRLSRCDRRDRVERAYDRTSAYVPPLRRSTRRYPSQRDEFHHPLASNSL